MKYSLEELKQIALQYNTKQELRKNNYSAYQCATKYKVMDLISEHMVCGRTKHTDEDIRNAAKQFETRFEFQKKSSLYSSAKRRGQTYLDDVCSHMKVMVKKRTHKSIKEDAKKYTTRKEFETKDPNGYAYCRRHNILDEVCEHMEYQHIYYTEEMIIKKAMEYKLLKDFYTENINMYLAAKRMKLTSKIKTILKVSKGGFDYQKKGILYYVSVNDGQAFKIGITNYNVKQRFKNDFYKLNIIFEKEYKNGYDAADAELKILRRFKKYKYKGDNLLENGNTELFNIDISMFPDFEKCL